MLGSLASADSTGTGGKPSALPSTCGSSCGNTITSRARSHIVSSPDPHEAAPRHHDVEAHQPIGVGADEGRISSVSGTA